MRRRDVLFRRGAAALAVLAIAAGAVGCNKSLIGADTGVWTIQVSAACTQARTTNVQVFVDNGFRGYAQPGDSGVSVEVAVGTHQFYAIAGNGTQWGPSSDYIASNGVTTTLRCGGQVRAGGDFESVRGPASGLLR